ncbi:polysaccharide deacetylase family protein [Streptomyces lichenis]|uniref:Polysaccharide deacetylase family protein n=1 Tax=Streptomyces lichenis TaxID=2306967 RepID=A0ABT0I7F7_9ACTN|nr:polysaccharide deacetylase family protein [Streptomyces lichenis]MCK8677250.1 polysaccharide deacetylase family protein [Streptomyces lichenis]
MQLVRQKGQKLVARAGVRARIALCALTLAALGSACATAEDGGAGAPGAAGQPRPEQAAGAAGALAAYAEKARKVQAARVVAARKWGLRQVPLPAPAPPAKKPEITFRKGFEVGDPSLPPVFTTVPTKEKIVFLTIDDGSEKDPELLRMMTELNLPYSAFLSDYLVKEDYGYFKQMQQRGVALHNHTLNHRYLPALSYEEQRQEICGMQDVIEKKYGKRPPLFRPPYGNYDSDTLRAARSCGVTAVPLWASEAFADHMEWREWDRDLHPGDIILSHFRGKGDWQGSMADMVRQVMNVITAKGYAVARLEDYV